jgi:hypothetical protein
MPLNDSITALSDLYVTVNDFDEVTVPEAAVNEMVPVTAVGGTINTSTPEVVE